MIGSARQATARQLLISRIAVVTLAVVSALYYFPAALCWWIPVGDFGIGIDPATAIVNDIAPRNAGKGIRVGDRVDLAAMSFRERSYLYEDVLKPPGLQMTVRAFHGKQLRTATFVTAIDEYTAVDRIYDSSSRVSAVIFILSGVILVWSRPSIMLWGLALFLIRTHDYSLGLLVSPTVAALLIFGYALIFSLGLPGLIIFAARFPDGSARRTTRYFDVIAFVCYLYYIYWSTHDYSPLFTSRPIGNVPGGALPEVLQGVAYLAVFIALCVRLRKTNRSTRGGLGWVVAGFGVGIIVGRLGLNSLSDFVSFDMEWLRLLQGAFMLALPVSVAYSVIRHRTFGLGHLANRTLVYSALTVGAVTTFSVGVWFASKQVPTTLGVVGAMVGALFVGMVFQAQQVRVVRLVDRIFLPHRYEAASSLDRVQDALRGITDAKRLADELTARLGLASIAVFSRTEDGGFVRKAACGWPDGTAWHLLPDETLTRSLDGRGPFIALVEDVDDDVTLPSANARPRVALTLRRSGRVERAIFVGSYRSGAILDRDAMRSLHSFFEEAALA